MTGSLEPLTINSNFEYILPYRLHEAKFIERPNRFLIRCRIKGSTVEAHLPDPGRLGELLLPGAFLLIRQAEGAKRKTRWSVAMVYQGDTAVSINSLLPNTLILQALKVGEVPGMEAALIRAEYPVGRHRYDFLVDRKGKKTLIEVKGVSLVEEGIAKFPDAVTERGRSHLQHLADMDGQLTDRMVIFIVQRPDAHIFMPHWERDPRFAEALINAHHAGVEIKIFSIETGRKKIRWKNELKMALSREEFQKYTNERDLR